MQTNADVDRLRQENRVKSQLIERVNLHACAMQEKNIELYRKIIMLDEECERLKEMNRQLTEQKSQLEEMNSFLQVQYEKEKGFLALLSQLPHAFITAIRRRIIKNEVIR